MKRFVLFLVISVSASLVFGGSARLEAASQEAKILNVGVTLALTGPGSGVGAAQTKCLGVLVDDLNKSGGVTIRGQRFNIKLIIEDDKYTAEGGRAAIEKLVSRDKVKVIICTMGAAPVMAGIDLTEANKVVFLTQTSDPRVVEPQYHYVYSTVSMRMGYPIYWGWIAKNRPEIKNKKICVLATDDITGHNEVNMHTRYMSTFGVNKPEPLYFKRGTTDYTPIATKIRELNPYMVACGGVQPGGQFASVLKALNESGWKGLKYNGAGIGLTENLEIAGKEAVERYLGAITDGSGLKSPPAQLLKLKELYEQRYGSGSWERERVAPSINWISAWYFLVGFLKKTAGLDSDVVSKSLQGIEVETPMGLARFITPPQRKDNPRTAEVTAEVRIGEIKDGKMNHIHTVSLDEGMGYISAVFK